MLLFFAVLASARVLRAEDDNTMYNNFGAVAFIRSGERTPVLRPDTPILTAFGAQQMLQLGKNFRHRYLVETGLPHGLGVQNIPDMSPDILNHEQLFIQTLNKPYLVSSAQAFMQGLYPPYSPNATRPDILGDAVGELANGDVVQYPLEGYQYPRVQALGELDPESVYISGNENCPTSQVESAMYEITDEFLNTQTLEKRFYGDLELGWFEGDVQDWMLDYRYAYELHDYLNYAYNHNATTFAALSSNDSSYAGVYDKVRYLANQDAYYRYGNASSYSPGASTDQAMAGKTLAALILGQFQKIITNNGNTTNGISRPLTLLFGDFEPLVSFFSLAMVDHLSQGFRAIPPFGSAMILELFSMRKDEEFPSDINDLWIRFYFHNGTDEFDDSGPTAYSMFGRGPSQMDMKWDDFQLMMTRIMVNQLADWCDTCSSGSLFCWGVDNSTVNILLAGGSSGAKSKISPAVGGVIGAVATLAIAGLLFGIAMFFGGIRFHRVDRRRDSKSALGGFKGSAKLASDPDLSLAKNATSPAGIVTSSFGKGSDGDAKGRVTHERVGSWELRQKETGAGPLDFKSGDFGGDLGDGVGAESRRESFEAIEAAMRRPVEPSERV
ncbi:phosphoglycerate mutase-like protein [Lentithecium fluviatile CBS 122367]|uniref:Phosphoglycerate mutase-like protein n=1 Tax=Lentithecium fluviatile CBS 122367 TaxID=1168545 RepID=A0A6G1IQ37_9PLEO|nr:phosphoglycerate mutase-like protein [Lentithecium fluviatile CBS 122367]